MKNENKTEKVKRPNKKVLLKEIADKTGKSLRELDSLGRSNIATIQWVNELVS
jgi:hypothetical protein|tara:strand:+ start:311 stop:469 length:159 start_codon:yes stop_codon:yes gene_type:complete